jgi:hypothetical protein
VAVIDLVSPEDEVLAAAYNRLERMRDPSHTHALSPITLRRLMQDAGLDIVRTASREIDVDVDRWLGLTDTPSATRQAILEEMTEDLRGLKTTGMRPFLRHDRLTFRQTWLIVVGEK